jgi:hypothetical protein
MKIQASDEFEGFCLGFDIALTRERAKAETADEALLRLDSAINESLSHFDLDGLVKLLTFLSCVFESKDPAREIEALWLSLKPTKVFFGRTKIGEREPAYIFIFKRVQKRLADEIMSRRRR